MDATPRLRGRRPLSGCDWWLAGQHPSLDVGLDLQAARYRLVVVRGERLSFASFHVRFDFHTCHSPFRFVVLICGDHRRTSTQAKWIWSLDQSFALSLREHFFSLTPTWRKSG